MSASKTSSVFPELRVIDLLDRIGGVGFCTCRSRRPQTVRRELAPCPWRHGLNEAHSMRSKVLTWLTIVLSVGLRSLPRTRRGVSPTKTRAAAPVRPVRCQGMIGFDNSSVLPDDAIFTKAVARTARFVGTPDLRHRHLANLPLAAAQEAISAVARLVAEFQTLTMENPLRASIP